MTKGNLAPKREAHDGVRVDSYGFAFETDRRARLSRTADECQQGDMGHC